MESVQTRAFAGAFLRWQDEVLLIHRGLHKKIAPGLWAGVAGHIEQAEANSPMAACLREIKEESGILPAQIEQLSLRYFALCKSPGTIDSIYYFAGVLREKPVLCQTSEGELHWIKLQDGIELEMAPHIKSFYIHWVSNLSDNSLNCFLDSDIQLLAGNQPK